MKFELEEIKQIRKKLGMTQTDLAKTANVSQSLIAKIESGNIDPTFSNANKIFDTLSSLTTKKEKKAKDIMQAKLITAHPGESIKSIIVKMKKHEISQVPVMEGKNIVGYISESIILDSLVNNKGEKIEEIMEEAPPVVAPNTGMMVVSNLLRFFPMVIVAEKGRPIGIITKSDILGNF